jgi:iron complex outermembrane receptor protein
MHMTKRRLVAVALIAVPGLASAQDPFRQTVVVTAAARPTELGSVTRTITVITREQIAALPAQSVADVLRLVASVDVRARGERGVQTDFAVRGANFGQLLVLVDGVRLNDAQSGHHNADIPVPLAAVERIEVLHGPGSSLFGADAFGGTINVITRRAGVAPSLTLHAGSFGMAGVSGVAALQDARHMVAASVDRSGGFIDGRDFTTAVARLRSTIGESSTVTFAYLWKEFGARNFYGATSTGDAMSREWTNQTLVTADHVFGTAAGWTMAGDGSYRTHGDEFRFTPASAASVHRTHEVLGEISASRALNSGATLTAGIEGGGTWIRSNNLGEHALQRLSAFGEWRQALGRRTYVDASMRVDRYSEFGMSGSPAAGVGWWPAAPIRLRASVGRAFRIPTFTERYYSDRNHLARPEVTAEHAWAGEGGADLFLQNGWTIFATVFTRAEQDVIDWLCGDRTCGTPAATQRWRTYNIRDVDTRGLELGISKVFAGGTLVQAQYTGLDVDAASVALLSKYVLDFAPRSFTAASVFPLPGRFRAAPRLEYRRRTRTIGTSDYVLLDARVSRPLGSLVDLYVEGTNLFDVEYQEVLGVRMPGAAVTVGLAIRR